MDLWKSLAGMVEVELLCADPAFVLKRIAAVGISVFEIKEGTDGFGICFSIARRDFRQLKSISNKYGYECKVTNRIGLYWNMKSFASRPILIAGMVLFLFLSMYLPTRVLFFQVEGNSMIPSKLVLEACEEAGIGFGASRSAVRSERVKNALLESIPKLKWVGVNTKGCVAVITVRERSEEPEENTLGVSSVVASRDGVITSCTAERGNLLVRPGQAITAGEVLISGYTDCGLSIRATRAEGEIYAKTEREITAVIPAISQEKKQITRECKKYSLTLGKKRINFYKDSGILGDSCDKMYLNYILALPGGFELPVSLMVETWRFWDTEEEIIDSDRAVQQIQDASMRYLQSVMVAGTVMKSASQEQNTEELISLNTKYFCHEMIGQVRNEEKLIGYGN